MVRQLNQNIQNAQQAKAFDVWNRNWVRFVERNLGAWMHVDHGLGLYLFANANRRAPTNMHNNAISVNSMHRIRSAQDLALYNLTLSEVVDGFNGTAHLETWNEDPAWQGVREVAEQLTGIDDWCEAIFAANVVFEPLVGELFRSHLVMHAAPRNGDFVTPTVVGAEEYDYAERDLRYTRPMFQLLTNDREFADQQPGAAHAVDVDLGAARHLGRADPAAAVVAAGGQAAPLRGRPGRGQDPLRRHRDRYRPGRPEGARAMTTATESPFKSDSTPSNKCGVTLMNNQVGEIVAQVMATKPNVTVIWLPSMMRVDAIGRMDVDLRRDLRGGGRGARLVQRRGVRGVHVHALRPDDPRGRPDDHVRQPRGRGRVHRLRPGGPDLAPGPSERGPYPRHRADRAPAIGQNVDRFASIFCSRHVVALSR